MGTDPFRYKQCIILRTDLDMSVGKLISQACHAAVGASELAKKQNHRIWRRWWDEGGRKVILQVNSLDELEEIVKEAGKLDIVNTVISDSGLTEVPPGTVTAAGLGPEITERMDKVTGDLRLLR